MVNQSIDVKCYWVPQKETIKSANIDTDLDTEIRRFELDPSNNSLQQLIDKILEVFKRLRDQIQSFELFYLDDDNEVVGFETDDELKYAINKFAAPILKLFIVNNT